TPSPPSAASPPLAKGRMELSPSQRGRRRRRRRGGRRVIRAIRRFSKFTSSFPSCRGGEPCCGGPRGCRYHRRQRHSCAVLYLLVFGGEWLLGPQVHAANRRKFSATT